MQTTSLTVSAPNLFVERNGRRLAYRRFGAGQHILFCNRFRGDLDTWDPAFLDALAALGFEVIIFDYSGLGLSTGERTYNPLVLAKDVIDLLDTLDLPQVVLGGCVPVSGEWAGSLLAATGGKPRSNFFPAPAVLEALKHTSIPMLHIATSANDRGGRKPRGRFCALGASSRGPATATYLRQRGGRYRRNGHGRPPRWYARTGATQPAQRGPAGGSRGRSLAGTAGARPVRSGAGTSTIKR
nr:hypothetical protein [Tanacetum cinerariifolium]